jgi:hypothetical protein
MSNVGTTRVVRMPKAEAWALFDALPPRLREVLRNTIGNYNAKAVHEVLRKNRGNAAKTADWIIQRDMEIHGQSVDIIL